MIQRLALCLTLLPLSGCAPDFSMLWTDGGGGVLLSAWTDGDETLAVGGHLNGTGAVLVRGTDDGWCSDITVADRPLWWIHGDGDGTWYGVGDDGLILRQENGELVDESVDTEATLFGVWVDGARVWAVGGDVWGTGLGEIWLREDGEWTLYSGGHPGVLFKVWENWFVGDGQAMRLEDDELVDRAPEGNPKLLTVRGRSADDVWAVGGRVRAEAYHWDGSAWTSVEVNPLCTSSPLNGVWTAPEQDVWIAGGQGAMARWDGSEWTCPDVQLTLDDFHAIWPRGDDVLAFGGDLMNMDNSNHSSVARYGQGSSTAALTSCP